MESGAQRVRIDVAVGDDAGELRTGTKFRAWRVPRTMDPINSMSIRFMTLRPCMAERRNVE